MTDERLVLTEVDGPVAVLTLNRPKALNALSPELIDELIAAIEASDADPAIRCIVLTGGPRVFAAGADIKAMAAATPTEMLRRGNIAKWARISACTKPIIAAVSGYALGGGCELALACDFRIASDKAKLGQPEILLGIIPGGGGTQRLPRLIGPAKAKDLIFTGRQVRADEALAIGLVDEVVEAGTELDRAIERAAELARGAVVAQGLAKRAIDRGLDITLNGGLDLEQQLFAEVFTTDDANAGVQSFLEHGPGKATFSGK